MKEHFEMRKKAFGPNLQNDFMLAHGVEYAFNAGSFAGPRAERNQCYANATHLALYNKDLTYVEGYVAIHGVPIEHAWCVDADGVVVDPTIEDVGQVVGYFGVPFKTAYLKRAIIMNDVYGLLDWYYARKTSGALYRLGLDEGQAWLLDQPVKKTRKRRTAA